MDGMSLVSGFGVLVLGYIFWVWWKDGKSLKPWGERIRQGLRDAFGVNSRDDVRTIQENLQQLTQQAETRLANLEETVKFSTQLHYVSKEFERRLTQLEKSEGSKGSKNPVGYHRPQSIVRLGLRLTLSDGLWGYLGISRVEDIDDPQIDSMLQGPFCPVCLKRWVGRNQTHHSNEVQAQCRQCGHSWDRQESIDFPISLVEMKRRIHAKLDEEYRAGGIIRPYDF